MTRSPAPFPFRTGIGYDVHRFAEGRRLVLGGVEIPHPRGLDGHSDADVLLHAIMDAMLGAAGLPDIGHHFSNRDPQWRGISSVILLGKTNALVHAAGWRPVNIDASVIAEEPKIGPHIAAMRLVISTALEIEASAAGIKATTNEGLGFIGRGEGIAAMAVAMLARVD